MSDTPPPNLAPIDLAVELPRLQEQRLEAFEAGSGPWSWSKGAVDAAKDFFQTTVGLPAEAFALGDPTEIVDEREFGPPPVQRVPVTFNYNGQSVEWQFDFRLWVEDVRRPHFQDSEQEDVGFALRNSNDEEVLSGTMRSPERIGDPWTARGELHGPDVTGVPLYEVAGALNKALAAEVGHGHEHSSHGL